MPSETIDRLRAVQGARFVRGNADRGLIDEFDRKPPAEMSGPFREWCAQQLTRRHRDFLASFEDNVDVDGVDGLGRVLFCHASARNDTDVFTVETPDERLRVLFAGVGADVVVCGHTHMQFDRRLDGIRVVNAGSVGMPYGKPGAYWAMLGPDVELRRTDYDRQAAAERIRRKKWDNAEKFADENVLKAPPIEQAMDFMRKMEAEQTASA
jgi:diadenosine tetraphosphatase ApaH/serine/threonine PP2A family protein phosphatase